MARENKTAPTAVSVSEFLAGVADERRRREAEEVVELMRDVTGVKPQMWGASMIGFGVMKYTGADKVERETLAVGLAPRKAALTLYGVTFYGSNADVLAELGPHTTGKGCLYIKKLAAVDMSVLRRLIEIGWATNHSGD